MSNEPKRIPTREEMDEAFDMMAMGGLDPNPPKVRIDIGGLRKYAKDNGKSISELTIEETSQFIHEYN